MLPNLNKLDVNQINEALINAGYTDNQLASVRFIRANSGDRQQWMYAITSNDGEGGYVYVAIDHAGYIVAEF
jgi:hypothetical protein